MRQWWAERAAWGARAWLLAIAAGTLGVALATIGAIALAYQMPVRGAVQTGGLGDQWFLRTTEAQRQSATDDGLVYPDEMDAAGRRFRWTRGRALLGFPALGGNQGYELTITAEGWPADVLRRDLAQPYVHVFANGRPVGVWQPTGAIADYALAIPPTAASDLLIDLRLAATPAEAPLLSQTATFTGTTKYPGDDRPHGLRLYAVALRSQSAGPTVPAAPLLWQGALLAALAALAVGPSRQRAGRWAAGGLGLGLILAVVAAVARVWAAPLVGVLLPLAALVALWRWRAPIRRFLGGWRARAAASQAPGYGLALAAVLVLVLGFGPDIIQKGRELFARARMIDPAAIVGMSLIGTLALLVALRWGDINRALDRVNRRLRTRPRLGWALLALLAVVWLGYGWTVVRATPYLGNADYSDNGVVARNLVAGRGWVVDYVSQFYRLEPGGAVTRVQETWPLLQPVWIAPFFAIFGPSAWAAKIPNVIFFGILAWLVYHIAVLLWDRRVGLAAAMLVLINKHMFRLLLYSTSDLAFVVFYLAAVWLLWRAVQRGDRRLLFWSGLLVGLMCWQKTSAVVIAAGMGLWAGWRAWHSPRDLRPRVFRTLALWWALPAALVFAPFVARNLIEFGKPVFSTESYDAWVIDYKGSGQAEDIYDVMTTEGGLPGQGLPDPSWIKRWGYERTRIKIANQLKAVRDYLMPASDGLGPLSGKGNLMGNLSTASAIGAAEDPPTAWLMAGSVLAFAGIFILRRRQARLMSLVLWSFAPYVAFLATYWHANEERYFVPLIPFLALLASGALWAIHDAIAAVAGGRARPLALLVGGALLVLALRPGWIEAQNKSSPAGERADWATDLAAFEWLKSNTPPGSVVMTRVPWQLNFHAERPAVMSPNHPSLDVTLQIGRYYGARYLLVNAITNNKDDSAVALRELLRGQEVRGFKQVASFNSMDYDSAKDRTVYIYEFPGDYGNVPPLALGDQ